MSENPEYAGSAPWRRFRRGRVAVEVAGEPVAVVRAEARSTRSDVCSHAECLVRGEVYDHTIECWLHGSCFDLRTASHGYPATEPVPVYPVKIEGDDVYVALTISNKES